VAKRTGQGRADVHLRNLQILDDLSVLFVDHLVRLDQNLTGLWIDHGSDRRAAQQALGHRLAHAPGFRQRHPDSRPGATVHSIDDHVLGYVHQAPGQIACVGRSQGRIGQTFARAVS
jgi:hypothetical protein